MKKYIAHVLPYVIPSMLLLVVLVVTLTQPAYAQFSDDPFGLSRLKVGLFRGDFLEAAAALLNFVLLVAGIVAFFFVLYGGFVYLTAGGDAARAGSGRTIIINAIIGIIIIFLSYALIRFVTTRTQQEEENSKFDTTQTVPSLRAG
jgi:hypothetical protein